MCAAPPRPVRSVRQSVRRAGALQRLWTSPVNPHTTALRRSLSLLCRCLAWGCWCGPGHPCLRCATFPHPPCSPLPLLSLPVLPPRESPSTPCVPSPVPLPVLPFPLPLPCLFVAPHPVYPSPRDLTLRPFNQAVPVATVGGGVISQSAVMSTTVTLVCGGPLSRKRRLHGHS